MKIGDKVSVIDEDISGKIKTIIGNKVILEDDDGFEYQFAKKELVKELESINHHDFTPKNISKILSEKKSDLRKKSQKVKPKERNLPPMEVDLHIHQLTSSTRGMDNYDMLTLQLDTAKRQLDYAISKRVQKVVFIHGVGSGVLRTELNYLLKKYDNIDFYDADYQKYGVGATEVYIYQNKK